MISIAIAEVFLIFFFSLVLHNLVANEAEWPLVINSQETRSDTKFAECHSIL